MSLLSQFEEGADWEDWEIGTHGIIIHFALAGQRGDYSATYLPEVAEREGWTRREAVDFLIQKAGYNGRVTEELRRAVKLTRYQSQTCTLSHAEYQSGWAGHVHAGLTN